MLKVIKTYYPYFPIIGLGLYLTLFVITTNDYSGGSINAPNAVGYSFFDNFLCDVMTRTSAGSMQNNMRSLAIVAHWILSFTMIIFFYLLPEIFEERNRNTFLVRFFGVLTMTVFIFMFTDYHDLIVTLTGLLGTVALIPFFIELRHYHGKRFKQLAYLCFLLSIVVYLIFETKIGFYYLPFLQKITFIFDAWWVIWVSIIVLQRNEKTREGSR